MKGNVQCWIWDAGYMIAITGRSERYQIRMQSSPTEAGQIRGGKVPQGLGSLLSNFLQRVCRCNIKSVHKQFGYPIGSTGEKCSDFCPRSLRIEQNSKIWKLMIWPNLQNAVKKEENFTKMFGQSRGKRCFLAERILRTLRYKFEEIVRATQFGCRSCVRSYMAGTREEGI